MTGPYTWGGRQGLHHSAVILPIPGTSSVAHVEQNVAAAHVELWDEDVSVLDMIA
jgi:aryl-alcohol dehydrogenase-like predicted oxidoreductase